MVAGKTRPLPGGSLDGSPKDILGNPDGSFNGGLAINPQRLLANLRAFREFTDTPEDGVTRFSYGLQDDRARAYIFRLATKHGCRVQTDDLENILIDLPGNKPGKPVVLAGSHIDTVRNGGWLDGIYGTCAALEVLETLAETLAEGPHANEAGPGALWKAGETPCNYQVVIFAEEEGSNFGSTMTGSKFLTGIYRDGDLDSLTDDTGRSLRQVLTQRRESQGERNGVPKGTAGAGVLASAVGAAETGDGAGNRASAGTIGIPTPDTTLTCPWDLRSVKTMLELHIEQGPVLDRAGVSLGIVDAIFGMRVVEVTLTGVGNHAGATPMKERCDALSAAAECLLAAETIVREDPDQRTVATVGKLDLAPGCSNVIPEEVRFTIEVRDKDRDKIDAAMEKILQNVRRIARDRGAAFSIREHSRSAPLQLSDRLKEKMQTIAQTKGITCKVMDSGAVHDACMLASYADTGMIFVPSIGGRSHVPEEDTRQEDLTAGAQFLMDLVTSELRESPE